MTKEITKAFILQRITDELALRELEPEKFAFSELVVPTYNIERQLKNWRVESKTLSITSTGPKLFFYPAQDERWVINGYSTVFMTGAYTIAGMYITRNLGSDFVYLDLTAAQNTSYTVNLPKPLELLFGDKLIANVDGYTTTGDLMVNVDVNVEKIR